MDSISIKSFNKVVLVNDKELILNFDDNGFLKKFIELFDKAKLVYEYNKKGNVDEENIKLINNMSDGIDDLFGENSCFNLFGCKYPNLTILTEFFSFMAPYANEFSKNSSDRIEKISEKYNANRIGDSDV